MKLRIAKKIINKLNADQSCKVRVITWRKAISKCNGHYKDRDWFIKLFCKTFGFEYIT